MTCKILLLIVLLHGFCPAHSQQLSWRKKFASTAVTVGLNPLNPSTVFAEGESGKLYVSYDGGLSWSYRSSPGNFHFRQIVIHPVDTMTILCASTFAQSLEKSTDYGLTWRPVLSTVGLTDETIGIDPSHPDTMYLGNSANSRVYRSTDRGDSWSLRSTLPRSLVSLALRPDSTSILYAGTNGPAVYKSLDSGLTWRQVYNGGTNAGDISAIVISRANPLIAYATIEGSPDTSTGPLKTTDGGESWQRESLGLSMAGIAIGEPDPDDVFAGSSDNRTTAIFETKDGGASWTPISAGLPGGDHIWSLASHPADPTVIWAALTQGISNPGGVYRLGRADGAMHGAVLAGGSNDTVKIGTVYIAGTTDSSSLSLSGVYSFQHYDVDPLPPTAHIEAYPYYIKDTTLGTDSSVSQTILMQELPLITLEGTIQDSAQHHAVRSTVTVGVTTSFCNVGLVYQTDTSGHFEFTNIAQPYPPLISDYSISVDPAVPYAPLLISPLHVDTLGLSLSLTVQPADVFVVGEDSADYASYYRAALDSLGLHAVLWNSITKGPAPIQRAIEFRKKTVVYFSGTKHTPLSGTDLKNLAAGLDAGCNLFLTGQDIAEKNDSSDLLANKIGVKFGGNTGVVTALAQPGDLFNGEAFYTTGGGASDQTSRDVLTIINPRARAVLTYGVAGVAGIRVDSVGSGGKCLVLGFGFESIRDARSRKVFMQRVMGYFDGSIVADAGAVQGMPGSFVLEQNFPNPFNPQTRIQFTLPRSAYAELKVFDMLGRQIAILISEELPAGKHSVKFNAEGLPSGIYFYRLKAGAFSLCKKLMVLR